MTKQRALIFDIIQQSSHHLHAEEIYRRAKEKLPQIAMGTVYRNLGLMVAAGEIIRISIPNGADRYDKAAMRHEHLTCQGCGRIMDIKLNGFADFVEKQTGEKLAGYKLHLEYICNKCN